MRFVAAVCAVALLLVAFSHKLAFGTTNRIVAANGTELVAYSHNLSRDVGAYSGLGAWLSVYDRLAWVSPERTVAMLAARHVHTLFLETSNYRQTVDVVRPSAVGRFLDAAHAAGIDVVAWYLPSLANPPRDLRRSLAAIRFAAPDGARFDAFALDVESTVVRSFGLRNARALALAARVRRTAPASLALGAITIAPVGSSPSYWPSFPFRGLSRLVDVVLPMEYFTARTSGAAGVRAYSAANVRVIRAEVGPRFPIHPIGGIADSATRSEVRAFVQATLACGSVGGSLWEATQTTPAQWSELAPLAATPRAAAASAHCP